MKKLSVIIVNYNVKYFLEQCLYSVFDAGKCVDIEVIVIDNNSVDGSVKMLKEKFPEVKLIENKKNTGFAKANNQGIKISKGEYVLLLNPDTIVEHDTLEKVVKFMDEHPDAGGLGVKMVDGKGDFLPESKRGLPTPFVAFYKIFGLSKLFPKSKIFGKYHLGYLDKDETNQVEILAGAFMLLRKKTLDEVGLLDENFFMYGEDIDLSYRIVKAGYKNYYFPKTRIIHYKGESTKKSSVNYVVVFYKAMVIFAKKHFSKKNAKLFSFFIKIAIFFRASIAIFHRFFSKVMFPVLDFIFLFSGTYFFINIWEQKIIIPKSGHYPVELFYIVIPLYALVWIFSVYLSGGYDKPAKIHKIFQGIAIGTITILVIYALLPETCRFSRVLILFGAIWGLVSMVSIRLLFYLINPKKYKLDSEKNNRFIIVGDKDEAMRVAGLLRNTYINPGFIGLVDVNKNNHKNNGFIGHLSQIKEIISIYKIDEVIFCSKNVPAQQIIDKMSELNNSSVEYKIAPSESLYIIGSNSINTVGDLYIVDINSVNKIINKRNKRFFDIVSSIILLILSPLMLPFVKHFFGLYKNIFLVLLAKRTWVGYYILEKDTNISVNLPKIKKSVLNPVDGLKQNDISEETIEKLNMLYARDYKVLNDINIMIKAYKKLGN